MVFQLLIRFIERAQVFNSEFDWTGATALELNQSKVEQFDTLHCCAMLQCLTNVPAAS